MELRRSPRINVTWRSGIKLSDGRLVMAKVINISADGLLLHCSENLVAMRVYPMMIEIPRIDKLSEIFNVACKGTIRHSVLSGDTYRVGVQLSEMSSLHAELVDAWINKIAAIS